MLRLEVISLLVFTFCMQKIEEAGIWFLAWFLWCVRFAAHVLQQLSSSPF